MIQDIGEHKIEIVYDKDAVLQKEDYVIGFEKGKALTGGENPLSLLSCEDILPIEYEKEAMERFRKHAIYLMRVEGKSLFLLPAKHLLGCRKMRKYGIREVREMEPVAMVYTVVTAYHLNQWYDTTKFCGACGVRLVHAKEERAMVCPICGNRIYPRISPAVIAAVVHEDKILLTKYDKDAKFYALVAGYCEIGETVEDTVHREIMEETGVKVKNLRYYKSQPWGFSQSLLYGYFVELDGTDQIHMDEHELSVAKWVSREELVDDNRGRISLTGEMIEYFRTHPEEF